MNDFNSVRDEYLAWKQAHPDDQTDLGSFAQLRDAADGTGSRRIAYNPGVIQEANAGIDRFFRPAGDVLSQNIGKPIDEALGSGTAAQSALGGAPRAVTEGLSYFIPGLGEATGGARIAALTGKGVALGSSAMRGYADNPEHPLASAALSAASLPIGGYLGSLGGKIAGDLVTGNTVEELTNVNPLAEKLAHFVGSNTGVMVGNEGVRQAQSLVNGEGLQNPFTKENIVGNVAGLLPFLPHTIADMARAGTNPEVAKIRANKLQLYYDAIAASDKAKAQAAQTAESMPATTNALAISQASAEMATAKQLSLFANDKPGTDRSYEDTNAGDNAVAKVMQGGVPKGVTINFDKVVNPTLTEVPKVGIPTPDDTVRFDPQGKPLPPEIEFSKSEPFDESKLTQLSQATSEGLDDPALLAKYAHDLNEQIKAQWELENKKTITTNKEGGDFFADENRPGREVVAPKALNPTVLEALQSEGRVPKIDSKWIADNFNDALSRSTTNDPQEAYRHTIQKLANIAQEMVIAANRQKSLELQQQANLKATTKLSETEKDAIHAQNVSTLPKEAQEWLATQEAQDRTISKTKGGRDQWGWSMRRDIVDQAVKNFNPETEMTKITTNLDRKGNVVTRELPLMDAIKIPLKQRPLPTSMIGSNKEVSLEGMHESGQQTAAKSINEPADLDEARQQIKISDDEVGNPQMELSDVEVPEISSGSKTESNLSSKVLDKVREVYDQVRKSDMWQQFRNNFTDERGSVKSEPQKRVMFGQAVEAKVSGVGSEAAVAFAKRYLKQEKVTPQEVINALQGYWGKTDARWNNVQRQIGQMAGLTPPEIQAMSGINFELTGGRKGTLTADGELPTVRLGISDLMATHFRMKGYGPALVQRFTDMATKIANSFGTLADTTHLGELNVRDPKSLETVVSKVSEQLVAMGLHGNYYITPDGKSSLTPLIALAVGHSAQDETLQPFFNFMMVSNVAHEMVHEVQRTSMADLQSPDADIRQRAQAYVGVKNLAETLSKQDRYSILRNVFDVVVPPSVSRDSRGRMREEIGAYLSHGISSATEFVPMYAQMYAAGIASGGTKLSDLRTALAWEGPEVQAFIKGVYRDVSDFTEGFKQMAKNPYATADALGVWAIANSPYKTADAFGIIQKKMVDLLKPDSRTIAANQSITDVASLIGPASLDRLYQDAPPRSDFPLGDSDIEFMAKLGADPVEAKSRTQEALSWAKEAIFGKSNSAESAWKNNWMPFSHAAALAGVPIARDAANVLFKHGTRQRGLVDMMMEPILTRDKLNRLVFDEQSPVIKLLRGGDENSHSKFNDAMRVLQEFGDAGKLDPKKLNPQAVFSSALQLPEFAKEISPILEKVRPPDRALIVGAADKLAQIYQNSGVVRMQSALETNANKLAKVMQTINPKAAYDQLYQQGQNLVNGLHYRNAKMVQDGLAGFDVQQSRSLSQLAEVVNSPLVDLQATLDNRPYFMSEARQGRFIVESKDAQGNKQTDGARDEGAALELQAKLKKEGNTDVSFYDKYERYGQFAGDLPSNYAVKYSQLETAAFEKALEGIKATFGPDVALKLSQDFNPARAVQQHVASTTVAKYDMQRKLAGGRERLDYIQNTNGYVHGLAQNLANRKTREAMGLILGDSRMQAAPDFINHANLMLNNVLTPASQTISQMRTVATGYQLGCQIAGPIVNPVQDVSLGWSQLVRNGDSVLQGGTRLIKALSTVGETYLNPKKFGRLADEAAAAPDVNKLDFEHQQAFYLRKFADEEPRVNSYDDLQLSDTRGLIARANIGLGNSSVTEKAQLAKNGLVGLAQKFVHMYGWSSALSSQALFAGAFEQAHQQGLRGEAAYDAARLQLYQTVGGGGKANQIGLVASGNQSGSSLIRTGTGMMSVMQSFGLNLFTLYGVTAKEAILRNPDLPPGQRAQSAKAFGVMLMTQGALAGALGIPGTAAVLAGLEKVFGIQANAAVRQGLASLGGDDKELGATISDGALNGLANQLFGLDVGGKTGLSSLLGFNGYDGFNMKDLFGPVPGMLGNMVDAVQQTTMGQPRRAVTDLLPQGFKNLAQLVSTTTRYGAPQIMDSANNLIMKPSNLQSVLYAIGFKPKQLQQYQTAQGLLQTSDKLSARLRLRDTDRLATGLINGDTQSVQDYIHEQTQNNPSINPKDLLDAIVEKAVDMQEPRDLLSSGGRMNAQNEQLIASSFPSSAVPRMSEMQRLQTKQSMYQRMGNPMGMGIPDGQEYVRAALVDQLIQGQGLTKAQATRAAALQLGATPYRQMF